MSLLVPRADIIDFMPSSFVGRDDWMDGASPRLNFPTAGDNKGGLNRVASAGVDMTKSGNPCDDALTIPPSLVVSSETTTPRSNAVEAMIKKGDNVLSIYVAPGRLGLTVTTAASPGGPTRGARIDSINLDCPFRDKVSVGDIIITINDKEVMTSFDFSVGADRMRKLGIIRGANANEYPIRNHLLPLRG